MTARLISIVGPPAVGKTTLAELLADELPAGLIREDYAGNPFLAESYRGAAAWRLPAQIHFLMSRARQLAISTWPAEGLFVSDYGLCQDRIYARARLGDDEFSLYHRLAPQVADLLHRPELLIHLDAAEAVLLERIGRRGREFENAMTAEFLAALRDAYGKAVRQARCPVLRVDCERTDLRLAGPRAELTAEIRRALPAGD